MSQVKVNEIYDASGGSAAKLYGSSMRYGGTAFVNRIINGDMRIDQRNNGASVTLTNSQYAIDRWRSEVSAGTGGAYSVQRSTVAPAGFNNSALITVTTADTSIASTDYYDFQQFIEGFNVADLGWGTASAQTVTLSFWVRSSLTGTFSGSVGNGAANRSYVFSYSISAANTWEQKTVTIPGDTAGTWLTDSSRGLCLTFDLGNGSAYTQASAGAWVATYAAGLTSAVKLISTVGATFYITGVQLEAGTVATPFERRDYGRELMMCQRYYCKTFAPETAPAQNAGNNGAIGFISQAAQPWDAMWKFPVEMRVQPTIVTYSTNAASSNWSTNTYTPTASVATAGTGVLSLRASGIGAAGYAFTIHVTAAAEL